LENTKVALFTWGDVLNKQSKVTGAHSWVPSTLGSVLFVTVFDSYAETVLKVCITGYYYITRKWVSRCLLGLGLGSRRGSLRISGLGSRRGSLGIGGAGLASAALFCVLASSFFSGFADEAPHSLKLLLQEVISLDDRRMRKRGKDRCYSHVSGLTYGKRTGLVFALGRRKRNELSAIRKLRSFKSEPPRNVRQVATPPTKPKQGSQQLWESGARAYSFSERTSMLEFIVGLREEPFGIAI
jgi:hypothetical protein